MNLHFTTILLIIFEQIIKIFTQGVPISPCPKIFQYRFDGSEWFGILSVNNPDFGQALHLRVTLTIRGKPATDYLGEIELLTRGQFAKGTPVFYKIKFPKSQFPPKLLKISVNNQIVCIGAGDQGIFVTQIQLEHTRKFTYIPDELQPSGQGLSPSSLSLGGFEHDDSASLSTMGIKEFATLPTNIALDTKNLPLTNIEKNPMRLLKNICGAIDDRIRFQVLHKLKQTEAALVSSSANSPAKNSTTNVESLLMSSLLARQGSEISMGDKLAIYAAKIEEAEPNSEDGDEDDGDVRLPPIVTSDDAGFDYDSTFDELPSITRGAWPWLAAVYVNNITSLSYQCGGTLVSTRIVISSAHCFHLFKQRFTANEVLVFLGRHNLKNWNEEGSLAAPVDDIFIHPEYNQHLNSYDADIAVVVLRNEVRFNTFIRPACMWSGSTNTQYIVGEHGVVVGWGLGGLNATRKVSSSSLVPKIVSAPIVSNEACFRVNSKYYSLSSNRTFCAGTVIENHSSAKKHRIQKGPCTGDSGSGLMIFKNNRWFLRGTVSGLLSIPSPTDNLSTSQQGCSINQFVIYTDVAQFLDWIFAFII